MSKTASQRLLPGFVEVPPTPPTEPPSPAPVIPEIPVLNTVPGSGDTVYVVDAHSLIYQVFHAMPEMTGPNGQPVGAIQGFMRDLLHLIQERQPTHLFCAFDPPGGTFRNELYEQYKGDRKEMPDDLQLQMPNIRRMVKALNIPIVEVPGFEADDVLATIARRSEAAGAHCVIVSGDKDCRQLISDHVRIYNIRKGLLFDPAMLRDEWGIRPDQVVDFQALVGDSIDCIPGVPLIGPKIARELLQKYQTLQNLLDHAQEVAGAKRRENLIAYREQALMSRQLARLEDDVPIEIDWAAGRLGGVHRDELQDLCREFGFRSLAERFSALSAIAAPTVWEAEYLTVATPQGLDNLAKELASQTRFVFDITTTSPSPRSTEIVGYSFAWQQGKAWYVPVRAPVGEPQSEPQLAVELLRPIFEDPRIAKIGHNIKFDMIVLRSVGIELRGASFDTMVADYLLAPGERTHNLNDMARRFLNHQTITIDQLTGSGKHQKRIVEIPVAQVTQYAGQDADVTLRLMSILEPRLIEDGLLPLFNELEMRLVEVLAELEFHGIRIDIAKLRDLSHKYGQRLKVLEQEIHTLAGGPFNIDSPTQLAKVLFEKLQLPSGRRTRTGHSTDVEVLSDLALLHPLPAKVIEYRQLAKLKSGYLDAIPDLVNSQTGRVHTSFKQDVAATGRLSSSDPNLQNIPIRSEAGREIRSAFLPGVSAWKLLAVDYSQIELRVLAHFSGDQVLCAAFDQDDDIHTRVASEVYRVERDAVTREMRRSAKAINFGVIYGQSPFGLAKSLGITQDVAATFINAYFARFQGVAKFIDLVLAESRKNGYVTTVLGRRRAVQGVRDPSQRTNSLQRNLPERIAINTVIQGSAADLIKQAMINVHGRMQREKLHARMLLQIHDELVFEVPSNELDCLASLVREEMSSAFQLKVPLRVDVKVGDNWAECEVWE